MEKIGAGKQTKKRTHMATLTDNLMNFKKKRGESDQNTKNKTQTPQNHESVFFYDDADYTGNIKDGEACYLTFADKH